MKIKVELSHKEHGNVETFVEIENTKDLVDEYPAICLAAGKNVASRFVDFESFGNDSKYMDRLEEVAAEFEIMDMTVIDQGADKRWCFYALHSGNDGDTYSEYVEAPNRDVAEFYARWMTAINENANPDEPEDFVDIMQGISIPDLYEEPISLDEAKIELRAAHDAMREFVAKCDRGEARSTRTYAAFQKLLSETKLPEATHAPA